jgi:hydrogenase nickel incorporation protein HypA/HybF
MHEVSIAREILDVVEKTARENNAEKVISVQLRIGKFTCIVRDALDFALDALKPGTVAENALFEIESVALHAHCLNCKKDFPDMEDFHFICLECGGTLEIVSGRELEIVAIEVDDRKRT